MQKRKGCVNRKTTETDIRINLVIEGSGRSKIDTGVGFLDHMLVLFARHGLFDLEVKAKGDLKVDRHHTVEDCGLMMGKAFFDALKDKKGIKRYGYAFVPMDETLAKVRVVLDISGRPGFYFSTTKRAAPSTHTDIDAGLMKEFLKAFSNEAKITLHADILKEDNVHHAMEAVFKALGVALDQATMIDKRAKDIPSTKGRL